MPARKTKSDVPPQTRKTLMIDPAKLELARKALGVDSDSEVMRIALDHLLSHFDGARDEEE